MSNYEMMREALQRKLQNPDWMAEKELEYDEIVGTDTTRLPIVLDARMPAFAELLDYLPADLPTFDEPTTIDGLWLDRWQRSSGAFTLTRLPDETVRLDYPTGARYIYRVAGTPGSSYHWIAEEYDLAGRRINSRRTTERYETHQEALFQMHRAALSDFDDLTNDY